MKRREFVTLLGGAAAWPLAVRAQPLERIRHVGVLLPAPRNDSEYPGLVQAFLQELRQLGWTNGGNVAVDIRWAGGAPDGIRKNAAELATLAPDVILASGNSAVGPLLQVTSKIPVVFVIVPDPVGAGFVNSLARPGGNATGRANMLDTLSAKLVELLREAFPAARRVAILWNPENEAKKLEFEACSAAAQALSMQVRSVEVNTAHELNAGFNTILSDRPDALLVFIDSTTISRKATIVAFAAMHRLPAIYQWRDYVRAGGLMSYGPNADHEWRQAAYLVDRILRGASPGELPIERPTKFETVLNMRTARALGITIPTSLLLRADEVIE